MSSISKAFFTNVLGDGSSKKVNKDLFQMFSKDEDIVEYGKRKVETEDDIPQKRTKGDGGQASKKDTKKRKDSSDSDSSEEEVEKEPSKRLKVESEEREDSSEDEFAQLKKIKEPRKVRLPEETNRTLVVENIPSSIKKKVLQCTTS